ncbi:AraC family transcriptional regulator [Dyadobacter sp. CY312]|uniref:helix-turn-helix transcriptional regulator n=1 Tax=Dyadobacter sp. CY312 TaxID=2907303 RepID=UPI001F1A4B12|nr:AraC family transcriptional regulator [Dyadobacter sp. CY312]MCE7040455.1 AraC family transcriptional regulator [Dyadobacter sp. CY312]
MGLIASLPDIDKNEFSVFVMHEKSEKLIPLHTHQKGQLSYVEGGIAYITIDYKTYVVPARHFFWIPKGIAHVVRIGQFATVFRSLYYYTEDDHTDPFYNQMGIYPASELLIQMIKFTECWDSSHVTRADYNFDFLVALKKLLTQNVHSRPIMLPSTEDERMNGIIEYLQQHLAQPIDLKGVSSHFNMSERSFSRFFQSTLQMSFFQYLKTLRMIQAIELIVKTRTPINEIAHLVGYQNVGSFSNAFFEFTNSRPSELRNN